MKVGKIVFTDELETPKKNYFNIYGVVLKYYKETNTVNVCWLLPVKNITKPKSYLEYDTPCEGL